MARNVWRTMRRMGVVALSALAMTLLYVTPVAAEENTAVSFSHYTKPFVENPAMITVGPDGALWFTQDYGGLGQGLIGRITTDGVLSKYTDPTIRWPRGITPGPDGA